MANLACYTFSDGGNLSNFSPMCFENIQRCATLASYYKSTDNVCSSQQVTALHLGVVKTDENDFGIPSNPSKYLFERLRSGQDAWLYGSDEGYYQYFPPTDQSLVYAQLLDLMKDRWTDKRTQQIDISMSVINVEQNLIAGLRFNFFIDDTGYVIPAIGIDVTRIAAYDFAYTVNQIRLALEILTLIMWLVQFCESIAGYRRFSKTHSELKGPEFWEKLYKSPYYDLPRDFQLLLFISIIAVWITLASATDLKNVMVTPSYVNDSNGKPFVLSAKPLLRIYRLLNAFHTFIFVFRVLKFAEVNPRIAIISNTVVRCKEVIVNYAVVLILILVFFALQAIILFAGNIAGYSNIGSALNMVVMTLIGQAEVGTRIVTDGGGAAKVGLATYQDLKSTNPTTAWIYYYPVKILYSFFLLNVIITILDDSYTHVRTLIDQTDDEENPDTYTPLTPSETKKYGKPMTLSMQAVHSFKKMISCEPKDEFGISKRLIVEFMAKLSTAIDWDCISYAELSQAQKDAGEKPISRESYDWLRERYPFICNRSRDLKEIHFKRALPPAGYDELIRLARSSLEEIVNRQSNMHAKLDDILEKCIA